MKMTKTKQESKSVGTIGAIAVNMLGGTGSCIGTQIVSLDKALMSFYRLSSVYSNHFAICNGFAAICNKKF